jgi:hypothetical protein
MCICDPEQRYAGSDLQTCLMLTHATKAREPTRAEASASRRP